MDFSHRLQEIMTNNGITKFKLSKQLNVSPSTIANWLNGESRPNIERISQLADFFNVTTDYLLSGNTASLSAQAAESDSFEQQIEDFLLASFRKLSVSDKIAVLQNIESLSQRKQTYERPAVPPYNEGFAFAENDTDASNRLTPHDVKRIKALLKEHDDTE